MPEHPGAENRCVNSEIDDRRGRAGRGPEYTTTKVYASSVGKFLRAKYAFPSAPTGNNFQLNGYRLQSGCSTVPPFCSDSTSSAGISAGPTR
jgi:hypothetical protein